MNDDKPVIVWPPAWMRRIQSKSYEKMSIRVTTSLAPDNCAKKLRRKMLNSYSASKKYRLWHKGKTSFGEVYKWIEEDWGAEGYRFEIKKYRFMVELFPTSQLRGIIIPLENGSEIRAKISYSGIVFSNLIGLVFVFYAFRAMGYFQFWLNWIFFAIMGTYFAVSVSRGFLDVKFLKEIIPTRFK